MEVVFLKLVNMSITAGWLILAVILLRPLLRKAPKWIRCALWALVGVRLVCPFTLESVVSLIPSAETLPPDFISAAAPEIHSGVPIVNRVVNPVLAESLAPSPAASANPTQIWSALFSLVWLVGLAVMLLYAVICYIRLRRRVAAAVPLGDGLWICDQIDTPFLLGLFRPRIYLPSDMGEGERVHVVAHERSHLKRRDHWWKPVGFAILAVYWFNPLVWAAYLLLCRDIELSCDEKVVRELSLEDKKAYSEALLACSVPRRLISACPLAFGEVGVKARIRSVLNYKKPAFWIVAAAVLVCAALAVCFLTDPKEKAPAGQEPFGHSYVTDELPYESGAYSFSLQGAYLQYELTEDLQLYRVSLKKDSTVEREHIGAFRACELTRDTFDKYFLFKNDLGWKDGEDRSAQLRGENKKAWRLDVESSENHEFCYLLLQKDGAVYLTRGYHDPEGETDPYSDDSSIRWLFHLARTDLLDCFAVSDGERVRLQPMFFPDGTREEAFTGLLPGLTGGSSSLCFDPQWETDTLTVAESRYAYADEGDEPELLRSANYVITKRNGEGQFEMSVSRTAGEQRHEYAVYAISGEHGNYALRLDFSDAGPSDDPYPDEGVGVVYVSDDCLFMTALSSFIPMDGDSGEYYVLTDNSFTARVKQSGGVHFSVQTDWNWRDFPWTDEEWYAFCGVGGIEHISALYGERRYLPLTGQDCLLQMNGELWLAHFSSHPSGEQFLWSIYRLVPETPAQGTDAFTARWTWYPWKSSEYPAFPFQFGMEYSEVRASCTGGSLIGFDDYGVDGYPQGRELTFPAGSTLYWSPLPGEGDTQTAAPVVEAEIRFSVYTGDEYLLCSGTITITEDPAGEAELGERHYTAVLSGAGLQFTQSSYRPGAVIDLVQPG